MISLLTHHIIPTTPTTTIVFALLSSLLFSSLLLSSLLISSHLLTGPFDDDHLFEEPPPADEAEKEKDSAWKSKLHKKSKVLLFPIIFLLRSIIFHPRAKPIIYTLYYIILHFQCTHTHTLTHSLTHSP